MLPENMYAIPDNFSINWYRYSHGGQTLEASGILNTPGSQGAAGTPSYTLTDIGANNTLTVHLGDVGADSIYTLTFTVRLTDNTLLSQQSQSLSTGNRVKISYDLEGDPKNYEVSGSMPVTNTLIDKVADGDYDYDTYELPWKVTVNPNSLNIDNAVFKDIQSTLLRWPVQIGAMKSLKPRMVLKSTYRCTMMPF